MSTPTVPRTSGILLHPTSLPGPFGVGDLGPVAYRWVETLAAMKQSWWQILPLGPTGAGDSPYQSFSAFAGAIKLLSPEVLRDEGLVEPSFWAGKHFPDHEVDFGLVNPFKTALLHEAWANFKAGKGAHLKAAFAEYATAEAAWLNDFALYTAIRDALGGLSLPDWPKELLHRKPAALAAAAKENADAVQMHKFGQFLFDRQWSQLRAFAAERGIKIIGDAPIFVAGDSADVWANAGEFLLDAELNPTVVAGVPPDYFAADGQHWGNPLYDWDRMEKSEYAWWTARIVRQLKQVDLIRLDHFRGFAQAWHIPAAEKTARKGKWVDGPGMKLFTKLRSVLKGLPLIAEDLGLITPDVVALRDDLGLPGMRVLQFALNGPHDLHWPHNYVPNSACYTGTHDNETVNGWFGSLNEDNKRYLGLTLGHYIGDPAWELIRLAWASVSALAVAPLQDVLSLGNDARMNKPGVAEGNWRWRFRVDQFRPDVIDRLRDLTALYNRIPSAVPKETGPETAG
ncbi:4-alpha-glucanotransferase : 4-alpha-glucanotransferase OS=Chloroflexus aurantiacus (strain ATCC 29364 / DSM 637 / Y-400-fl) GN=Chy400_4186 PE=3 SV=1: Glyco_hydro_77 [Gemmataceae bacterium]|nr:4-alpha-glucanotransferase : 4-alpha-glucanotransferase OS=Chloroflexus aurantiacus (strain ATCC 29364 / DSM 637 / Y-400-fl) GN=Chy400_4186 PE=3 SV=1: Glyco_hydro_77 [Gemmataceae bacterium]VTT98380.1 4-alpha-glucanotransferase : 4-alpha-glucanotransferase OS=Chloroflexus aurantiacus (strain ATCC 29364 / DSM 637 / Y-400-fl) GN=Chy400_4186 PE=3 SV=1: Glyco_hydro_77 [Gemmataceae bacterium]